MSDRPHIEELIQVKLGDAEITPTKGVWKGVQRQLRMKKLLRFDPGQLNIYYLGAILIAAAALITLISRNSTGAESPEHVPGSTQAVQETAAENESAFNRDQDTETAMETTKTVSDPDQAGKVMKDNRAAASESPSGEDKTGSATASEGMAGELSLDDSEPLPERPEQLTLVTYFTTSARSGCAPLTVRFFNSSINTGTISWSFGTGESSSDENPEYRFTEPGKYMVTLRAWGPDGQSGTHHQLIEVYPSPRAGFDFEEGLQGADETITLNLVNYSSSASSFVWDIVEKDGSAGGGWSSIEYQPALEISGNQAAGHSVRLVALNEYGCSDTAVSRIPPVSGPVKPLLRFPTAFSPNMTGPTGGSYDPYERRIDIFHPIISEEPAEYHLQIYSRLGELVYESYEIYRGWDGYHLQQRSAGGVYLWIAEGNWEDGSSFKLKGDVTLIWNDRWP